MAVLNGTTRNPSIARDPLAQMEVKQSGESPEIEELNEHISNWKAFQKTREYSVVSNLAEPYITRLEENLAKGVIELKASYPTLTIEEIEGVRAEWRGELRWWKMMMFGVGIMKRRLNELEDHMKDKEADKKDGDIPDNVKKYT
jgi:hypothetical protein